ncbi:MAG: hypothetical protein JXA14_19335 [Anaerolineae bacterium]|nr:hypothetical protein [Anaerolineae bacterium]
MSFDRLLPRIAALWIPVVVLSGCMSATSKPDTVGAFSIYLVKPGVSAQQMMETDLSQLELEAAPILSIDDIVTYTWETHEIELTNSARERLARLEVPVTTGVPFVVCVGDERIYGGAFWVSWSSMSFEGIVIDTLFAQMDNQPIRIQLGYPESPELFEGTDLRSDPRILQSLRSAGKLK